MLGLAKLMEIVLSPQLLWTAVDFITTKMVSTLNRFYFLKKKPKLAEDDEDDDEDEDDDDEYVFLF